MGGEGCPIGLISYTTFAKQRALAQGRLTIAAAAATPQPPIVGAPAIPHAARRRRRIFGMGAVH